MCTRLNMYTYMYMYICYESIGETGRKDNRSRDNWEEEDAGWVGSVVTEECDILGIDCLCESQHSEQ